MWLTLGGLVNLASHEPYRWGDANLDGSVDALDFSVWSDYRFTISAAWSLADFNADGVTDGSDFDLWSENRIRGIAPVLVRASIPRAPSIGPTVQDAHNRRENNITPWFRS
ncbi:MAG: hypothetical protein KDA60_09825 [Planctomycetales bacterium]|nr:hypothetical protein [Planctomycetales bacterium]